MNIQNKILPKNKERYDIVLRRLTAIYQYQDSLLQEGYKIDPRWDSMTYKLKLELLSLLESEEEKNG